MSVSAVRPLSITFVSATRDAPSARRFYGESFIAAFYRHGVETASLKPTIKMVSIFPKRTRGYTAARAIPLSYRFLVDLVKSRSDFVIVQEYGVVTFATLLVRKVLRRPALVFQEHEGRAGSPLSAVDTWYRRLIGHLATGFFANTAAARDEIVTILRVDPAKVFHVMTLVPPDRHELCKEPLTLEPPRFRPLFLYMGQLIVRKNIEALVRAAAILRDEGLTLEVWIGGEGSEEHHLRELAHKLHLDETVLFIGPIPYQSIGFVYDACDVFVMPSNVDVRSVAVLEAMRFGKPVIDSAFDGNAHDSVREKINGFIFDPAQPLQLANCMREFVVSPTLGAEMGLRSAEMMARHTPDSAALQVIEILSRLASRGG